MSTTQRRLVVIFGLLLFVASALFAIGATSTLARVVHILVCVVTVIAVAVLLRGPVRR